MAYRISDDCVNCQACVSACPMGAIESNGVKCEIDPGKCIECGACAGTCPTGAAHS